MSLFKKLWIVFSICLILDGAAPLMAAELAGTLTVAMYHDRNANGELDQNAMGIPREAYGHSNNARQGDVIRVVRVDDICYFKAEDKYTVARTPGEEHLIRTSIQALEKRLDPSQFQRVHRSAIVNIRRVKTVHRSLSGRMDIVLDEPPEKLRVSRRYAQQFKQM